MFGNNDGQQPANDFSGVSLPGQQPAGVPGFPAQPAPSMQPVDPTAPVLQDLSVPELPAAGTPDQPALSNSNWSPQPSTGPSLDDLAGLKQQALSQLTPIVGQLDQTPEEKFRTTMMMIQASDDQTLLKTAYDAAQAITDEKAKAQALLDVINEINYFSQKNQQQS